MLSLPEEIRTGAACSQITRKSAFLASLSRNGQSPSAPDFAVRGN